MATFLKKLLDTGVKPGVDFQESKKIRMTNQITLAMSCITFVYAFVFYFFGFKTEGLNLLVVVASMLISIYFNKLEYYLTARIWFILSLNVAVTWYSHIFGRETGIQLVFFPSACLPWVLFELKRWKYLTAGTIIPVLGYFIFRATDGLPTIEITHSVQYAIYSTLAFVVFLMLILFLLFFALQNSKSEQILSDTFKKFFEDIPTPMWIYDEKTLDFLAVNEFAIKKYGYTKQEFLHMNLMEILQSGIENGDISAKGAFTNERLADMGYVIHKKKDGSLFYVHKLANNTRHNDRMAKVVLAIDVNDKVQVEQKNEELNKTLTKANESLHASKEELESQQEELRQINEELTHQAEALKASEEELRIQEEELRQTNVELEEKTEMIQEASTALEIKAKELEASSKYKSEFLANMSHELRTPLNSVLILANLLKQNKNENLNDKQVEYASIIHKSGSDLLNLINDILDLSKIEAGKVEMVFEPVSIAEISRDMEQLFTVLAQEKKIAFSTIIKSELPAEIITDKQRLEQVVKNLLSNAFKFTPQNGTVELGFALEGDKIAISVADSGIGISPEKQELIFEAFQQADGSTSRRFGGTGLGLSISKELTRRLGGIIRLSSSTNKGSIFQLVLPLTYSDVASTAESIQEVQKPLTYDLDNVQEQTIIEDDKTLISPGQQSILIIEDDPVFANHVKDFAHEKGYKTIIAISGDEGLFYARKYKPTAIILDLGLPVIDGKSLLRILKSEDDLKHIPVHVVTANDRAELAGTGAENYLLKPIMDSDLEKTFTNIGFHVATRYRNILLLSPHDTVISNVFEKLDVTKSGEVTFDVAFTITEALKLLNQKAIDCIIADIGSDITGGIENLEQLKAAAGADKYIITCLEGDISGAEEKQLKTYSESIIRKSVQYPHRLLDEVALFLHNINKPKTVSVPVHYDAAPDNDLSGKKVLLADDDMRNIFSVTALLEEHGMEVITAEHGKEALEMLAAHNDIDIVLMDIMMPEMDGYEAMERIRADVKYKKLPVIALTAKAMSGDREKCIASGASDYITKPIDSIKLFSLMRVWLAK